MVSRNQLSPEVCAKVLDVIAARGNLSEAARAAGVTMAQVHDLRRADSEFALAYDGAWEAYKDAVLIPEAARRAVEGVERGQYYRGVPTLDEHGRPVRERHHSDALLLRLLEVFDHRFKPHHVTEVREAPVGAQDLDALSPAARARLEAFLDQRQRDVEEIGRG